jgi:hypothetical protein
MSGKGAKMRRVEKRRNSKRDGLTERQFKHYRSLLRRGYDVSTALSSARKS